MGTMLFSTTELASIPTTGSGWTYLLSKANADAGTPNLANIDSVVQTGVLAAAIAYKRNGSGLGLTYIQGKLKAAPGTEEATTQPLNPYRQGLWLVIADLVDFTGTADNGQTYPAWAASLENKVLPGQTNWNTMRKCASTSGNNWGFYARSFLLAVALYTKNTTLRNEVIGWFARALSRTTHPITGANLPQYFTASGAFSPGWDGPDTTYPTTQGTINPESANADLNGANAEDSSRGSTAPPLIASGASYSMESQDAMLLTAVLIHRAGVTDLTGANVWQWANNAIKRNGVNVNHFSLYPSSNHIYWHLPYYFNAVYGTTFPTQAENYGGRALGYGAALFATGSTWLKNLGAPSTGGGGTTTPTVAPPTAHVVLTVPSANTIHADASSSTAGSAAITTYSFRLLQGTTVKASRAASSVATWDTTVTASGTYQVEVTATASDGGSDLDTGTVAVSTNRQPIARWTVTPTRGTAPLAVTYDATTSSDPDGTALTYTVNWGDASTNSTGATGSHTYDAQTSYPASFTAQLTVSDGTLTATAIATITVDDPTASSTVGAGVVIGGRYYRFASGGSTSPTSARQSILVGQWWTPFAGQSTGTPAAGDNRQVGFTLPKAITVDQVAAEVTTAGSTGALFRILVHNANSDLYPTTVAIDAGTIDAATTGVKTITLATPVTLPAGDYTIGGAVQGAPATAPTMRIVNAPPRSSSATTATLALGATGGYLQTGVTGAGGTFTSTVTSTSVLPKVVLHVSA